MPSVQVGVGVPRVEILLGVSRVLRDPREEQEAAGPHESGTTSGLRAEGGPTVEATVRVRGSESGLRARFGVN